VTFLAPALLLGLLATLLPPLIHLLNRREPKPVPFAAIELLRRAHLRTARRARLRQLLLIAVRALLLAALALAMARPYWEPRVEGAALSEVGGEGAQVLVLDVGYAMGLRVGGEAGEGETLLDRARAHALRALDESRGPVGLVTFGAQAEAPFGDPGADRSTLREALLRLSPTPAVGEPAEGVWAAFGLLRSRPAAERKRVWLLTSPRAARATLPPPPPELGEVEVVVVELVEGSADEVRRAVGNHAILQARVWPAPQVGAGQWAVEAEVANFSAAPLSLWPISVEVEGQALVRGFVSLAPGEVGLKRMYFKVEEAASLKGEALGVGLRGRVALAGDALPIDDARPFWISPAPPTRLLALNGDPRPVPHEDELFYLRRALAPEVTGEGRFEVRVEPSEGLAVGDEALAWADVVLLANVPRPSRALGAALLRFVEAGGGLWLAPGARAEAGRWNESLAPLLARPLREARRAGDAAASVRDRKVARLTQFERGHPLFAPFPDPLRSTLPQAQVLTYQLFDPAPTPQTAVVGTLDEGSPFLLTRAVGAGRALLMGGPLDREWSDLVIRPDFVPFAQQCARFLTRRAPERGREVAFGRPLALDLSGEGPFFDLSPEGERVVLTPTEGEAARAWSLPKARGLGHHQVLGEGGAVVERFVVSLDAKGSDLRPAVEEAGARAVAGGVRVEGRAGARRDLWPFALFGLFVLLALEALALSRGRGAGGARGLR
jgi:hypothetical protein